MVIVEGRKTEKDYFEGLRSRLKLSSTNVEVVPGSDSDPLRMVSFAKTKVMERKKNRSKSNYDQIWLVFDTEAPNSGRQWQRACQDAQKEGFRVALSSPVFELWFILHYIYTTAPLNDKTAAINKLKKYDPEYDSSEVENWRYFDKTKIAIDNACKLREHCRLTKSCNPLTDVDILVTSLNQATRDHNRLF